MRSAIKFFITIFACSYYLACIGRLLSDHPQSFAVTGILSLVGFLFIYLIRHILLVFFLSARRLRGHKTLSLIGDNTLWRMLSRGKEFQGIYLSQKISKPFVVKASEHKKYIFVPLERKKDLGLITEKEEFTFTKLDTFFLVMSLIFYNAYVLVSRLGMKHKKIIKYPVELLSSWMHILIRSTEPRVIRILSPRLQSGEV